MTMRHSRAKIAIALTASASFIGCWTSAQTGDELLRRVDAIERGQTESAEELTRELQTAKTKVTELEEVLDRATKVVQRASADTGAQVEQLQQQVMALEGQLAELRQEVTRQQAQYQEQRAETERQLKKISRHVGLEAAIEESEIPPTADAHWQAAQAAYEARQWPRARALYRAFTERHRQDQRIDDAIYRGAMTFMEEQRPATALGELRRVITEHPQGDVADDALLAMGDAFYQLHACTDARATLEALISAHPRSPLVAQARTKLRDIQRAPRGYCTS
jgi:TolA-binding protein